ncbi:MAG: ATP-binding protein, partial [Candidatus Neomarinimicrobiota bacterium]
RATEEGKLLYANPAMARMFGYESVYELLLLNFWELFFRPDSRENVTQAQAADGRVRELELGMRHRDGHEIWVIINSRLVQAEGPKVSWYEGTLNDITHRRLLEAERLKAQKLESIGSLAGGLAHDFNNFLSEIQLNCSSARLALAEKREDNEIATQLAAAEKAVFRAQGITKRLLTFSPGGGPVRAAQPLGPILREASELIVRVENIETTFDLPEQLSPVNVDAAQIGQIVRNLVLNARQAMPDGGRLELSAQNVTVGAGVTIGPLEPGLYVEVSVKDQGVGIPPEIMDRIYDPYMSTNSTGNGLGLFTCFTVLEKHDGWITATSKVGQGSTFRFYLPATAATSDILLAENVDSRAEKSCRILIMDDEEGIRLSLSLLLKKIGYESDTAADGESALSLYSEHLKAGDPYDTVIIDLTIPNGMGGIETVQKMKRMNPEVKAIMSSGYSTSPAMAHPDDYGFTEVLVKPYTIEDLTDTIERALRD